MSRPHGQLNVVSTHRSIKTSETFVDARKALVATLENLSFVKVVTTQITSAGYTGEAVEIHFRDAKEKPKLVFFDKFGRSRSNLTVGPIKLAQAPLGLDHPSAIPTVGEILVGSLVPNTRKSHLDHVLRGWSSDATPLKELLRLLKFGTKHSEFEVRQILLQPSCLLMRCPEQIKQCRDDIYTTARIILWSSYRHLQVLASIQEKWTLKEKASEEEITSSQNIKISSNAAEFIEAIVIKFNDSKLSEAFFSGLIIPQESAEYKAEYKEYKPNIASIFSDYSKPSETANNMIANADKMNEEEYDPSKTFVNKTPAYAPNSPVNSVTPDRTPPYNTYGTYAEYSSYSPSLPQQTVQNSQQPQSPAYVPSSPPYVPEHVPERVPERVPEAVERSAIERSAIERPKSPETLYEDL